VICESCHSILYNDASIHPSSPQYANRLTAGWEINLLLKPYEDDSPGIGDGTGEGDGVGSDLCIGCHSASAGDPGNHRMDSIDFARADQTNAPLFGGNAPGTLSLPLSTKMDCDTCHRPHSANVYSTVPPDARYTEKVYLILEVDNTASQWHQLCGQCHSQY
jgi:hypothetical protein